MVLNREQIMTRLPHRDPMLLIDTVEEMAEEKELVATFCPVASRDIFRGHFPSQPILPGIYSVESIAQAACVLALSTERYAGKLPLFLGIKNVCFMKKILPGDTIKIHVMWVSERVEKGIATFSAEVFNRGELAVTGEVTLALR